MIYPYQKSTMVVTVFFGIGSTMVNHMVYHG